MTSPALYKYLSIAGAKLTLGNRCFRHAKPSTFNDTEDLTIRSLFPEDDETALAVIENGFTDLLLKHLSDEPTCLNERMRLQLKCILAAFKANPDAARIVKEAKKNLPSVFNLEQMKQRHRDFVAEINTHMQDYRVLCVSSRKDSERMWESYADDHRGVVLRISPNIEKDSKYQLFRPVAYKAARPTLFESAQSFQEGSLFGDQQARITKAIEQIIYTKTLKWEYENEQRLAIPVGHDGDWDTMSYHPEEISEIYLGANGNNAWKAEVIALAKSVNPNIIVKEMFHTGNGRLFTRYYS